MNLNVVVLTGNLTRDPELRATTGGTEVCSMRLAVNGRRKNASGDWVDDPNFFDVTCFGKQAENCAQYLAKGRPVAVSGRLDWREWEKDGNKRQAVQVIANDIQFLGDGKGKREDPPAQTDIPAETSNIDAPTASEDDIPF